jgi:hypothetical protein
VLIVRMVAPRRVEQDRGVEHGTRERTDAGQPVERLGVGPGRDPSALGLYSHQIGPGSGDPHGAEAVGSQRRGHEPGRNGRRRPAGRATWRVVEVPRVAGHAERRPLGDRPLPELRRRGLADDHRAGRFQPPHGLGIAGLALERPRAPERGRLAGEVEVVLDRHGRPQERESLAGRAAPIGLIGLDQRRLGAHAPERIQRRLACLDLAQRGLDQLARADLALLEPLELSREAIRVLGDGGHSSARTSLAARSPERTAPSMYPFQ